MYEYEDTNRIRRAPSARPLSAPADEGDARAHARRALQDAYDWRDDESCAWTSAVAAAKAANAATSDDASPDVRSAAARAEARRSRQEVVRSISRTVGV